MTHLCIQLKDVPTRVRIKAAGVEEDKKLRELQAKDEQGNVIGRFMSDFVMGWWTEDSN